MARKMLEKFVHALDKKEALRGFGIFLLFTLFAILISRSIGQEQLEQWVIDAGIRGPLLIVLWKAFSVIMVPFTGSITYALAGSLYGARQAIWYTLIGNAIGITVSFFIGRKRGKPAVTWIVGEKHIEEVMHLIGHLTNRKTLGITRLVLFPLEDFINYASGMSKITYRKYFIVSIIIVTFLAIGPILFGHILI